MEPNHEITYVNISGIRHVNGKHDFSTSTEKYFFKKIIIL